MAVMGGNAPSQAWGHEVDVEGDVTAVSGLLSGSDVGLPARKAAAKRFSFFLLSRYLTWLFLFFNLLFLIGNSSKGKIGNSSKGEIGNSSEGEIGNLSEGEIGNSS